MSIEEKKPCLVIDLDETIIHSISKEEIKSIKGGKESLEKQGYKTHRMSGGYYTVVERPGLQEFLDYAFKNFRVSIWTAASKDYALFIIDDIILKDKPERELEWIFFSYHCEISTKKCRSIKNLSLLWDMFKLDGFTRDNTIIMDDHHKVYSTQKSNCIYMDPFHLDEEKDITEKAEDDFLKRLIPQLEKLKKQINNGEGVDTTDANSRLSK
jgi:TFIIF-interacting CTD phosphatase-like protein